MKIMGEGGNQKKADSPAELTFALFTEYIKFGFLRVLERRSGFIMLKEDLMKLLGDAMNVTLADTGVVDFEDGEMVLRTLRRFLRSVAKASIENE